MDEFRVDAISGFFKGMDAGVENFRGEGWGGGVERWSGAGCGGWEEEILESISWEEGSKFAGLRGDF